MHVALPLFSRRLLLLLALAALLAPAPVRASLEPGSPRAAVIEELGEPKNTARRGDREILTFPGGARIELSAGIVVNVSGYTPAARPSRVAPGLTPLPPKPAPSPIGSAHPASPGDDAANPAGGAKALGREVEKMSVAWSAAPPSTAHAPTDRAHAWLALALGLVLRFAVTLFALRAAFKYWEMDAFWRGTFAIAAIDVALHAGLEALGPATGGFTSMPGVENGVPGLVLIFTIRRFCFNKRLQNAILTAAAVKLVALLGQLLLTVFVLNSLFG